MAIKIGEITTLSVKDFTCLPDDRQTQVETHNGIAVQDFGRVIEGDKFSCTVTVRPEDAPILYMYWNSRTRVNVVDEAGNEHSNLRVVIKDYNPVPHFADYWQAELEFWRESATCRPCELMTPSTIQFHRPQGRHIQIGDVRTLSVENWHIVPDDRQRLIETIGGIVVEDFGHIEAGDRMTCRITLSAAAAEILNLYWHDRILTDVVDEGGRTWQALRVKVKKYGYVQHFPRYYWADLEFWKE